MSSIDTGPEEAGMGERRAVEVLADAFGWVLPSGDAAGRAVAALLAAVGGGPVVILEDGSLRGLEWRAHENSRGEFAGPTRLTLQDIRTGNVANPDWTTLYRLTVPGDPQKEREG